MKISIAAPLLAALAAVQPATASAQSPQNLFVNACVDGEAHLSPASAAEVGFAGLPDDLRSQYRLPTSARVWQIGGGPTYLYLFEMADKRGDLKKVCGVTSTDMDKLAITQALDVRLAGSTDSTPRKSTQWVRPSDGYVVTVTSAGRYVVAQVDWLSDRERRRYQKQVKSVAQ